MQQPVDTHFPAIYANAVSWTGLCMMSNKSALRKVLKPLAFLRGLSHCKPIQLCSPCCSTAGWLAEVQVSGLFQSSSPVQGCTQTRKLDTKKPSIVRHNTVEVNPTELIHGAQQHDLLYVYKQNGTEQSSAIDWKSQKLQR